MLISRHMRKSGVRKTGLQLPPSDLEGLIALANDDEESHLFELPQAMREDAATLRTWMEMLAVVNQRKLPDHRRLVGLINQALDGFTMIYRPSINPATLRLRGADAGGDWKSTKAALAFMFAQLFHDGAFARVRRCTECRRFFVSPLSRGPRSDFCSKTHANTFKKRRYRKSRQRREPLTYRRKDHP